MSPEDRIGRHDGHDLPQDPSAESATFHCHASALVIRQPEAPLHLQRGEVGAHSPI
jgi:hypothetical protein